MHHTLRYRDGYISTSRSDRHSKETISWCLGGDVFKEAPSFRSAQLAISRAMKQNPRRKASLTKIKSGNAIQWRLIDESGNDLAPPGFMSMGGARVYARDFRIDIIDIKLD